MTFAMVKHPRCEKLYWFQVPDGLDEPVIVGSIVSCDTSRGTNPGVVVSVMTCNSEDRIRSILKRDGATFPLRKITGVGKLVPLKSIIVPERMRRTTPSDHKLAARFLEWYHHGCFQTDVVIGDDSVLLDGYSAYLVAQELGHDRIFVKTKEAVV